MKRLVLYCFLIAACNSASNKKLTEQKFQVLYWPAFTEPSRLSVSGGTLSAVLGRHPYFEMATGPDTFYYRQIWLSNDQLCYLDSAIIRAANRTFEEPVRSIRDGISISFIQCGGMSADTLKFRNPSTGQPGHELSMKSIRFFKDAFQDSLLSPYFDEVAGYLQQTNATVDTLKLDALKRRREAVYPNFRYRR